MLPFCFLLLIASFLNAENGEDGGEGSIAHALVWERLAYNAFQLSWNPKTLINKGVKTVEVIAKHSGDPDRPRNVTVSVAVGEAILGMLLPNTLYSVKVTAYDDAVIVYSNRTSLKSWPTAPHDVSMPKGKAISPTQIELHWEETKYPNGILQPYKVFCYVSKSKAAPVSACTSDNTTTTITVDGLQPDTVYQCLVEGSTYPAAGQDPEECTMRSKLSSPIRTRPADEVDIAKEFHWERLRHNAFKLSWKPHKLMEKGVKTIKVIAKKPLDPDGVRNVTVSVKNGETKIGALLPDTQYTMDLTAYNGSKVVFTFQTPLKTWPTAPDGVSPPNGTAISSTQIQLHWKQPTHPNGIFQPYKVKCRIPRSGDAPISVITKDNTTTTVTVGGLLPDTIYRCLLEASTYPAKGQNPKQCTKQSKLSPPIRTKPAGSTTSSGYTVTSTNLLLIFACALEGLA